MVTAMTVLARAQERDPASQRCSWKEAGERWRKSFVMLTPMRAEIVWPKKIALGCAKGASIAPKSSTAVAPFNQ